MKTLLILGMLCENWFWDHSILIHADWANKFHVHKNLYVYLFVFIWLSKQPSPCLWIPTPCSLIPSIWLKMKTYLALKLSNYFLQFPALLQSLGWNTLLLCSRAPKEHGQLTLPVKAYWTSHWTSGTQMRHHLWFPTFRFTVSPYCFLCQKYPLCNTRKKLFAPFTSL